MTVWSTQQSEAIACVAAWLRTRWEPWFYLAGYAGTGKTTLAKHIASLQDGAIRYAAFTGKAAKVMRNAGCTNASTIHSLIYNTERDEVTGKIRMTLNESALRGVALVVIDECSMVDEDLGKDLVSFGVPILAIGGPGQLPPVRGAGFFTSGEPNYMLTDIHRQAKDSPIIRLATAVRERRFDKTHLVKVPGLTICKKADLDPKAVTGADSIIVGRNNTRNAYNSRLREIRGFDTSLPPQKGETLICLKNDKQLKIYNGETFEVARKNKASPGPDGLILHYSIVDPDDEKRGRVFIRVFEQFFSDPAAAKDIHWKILRGTQSFDFGYALTVHKSQGSQWSNVCVFDESRYFGDDAARHLYTSVTRAADHLTLVV